MSRNASFYLSEDTYETWKKFQRIAKREGRNASIILRNYITEYVDIHDPGNPQTRMTSFDETGDSTIAIVEGRIREQFKQRYRNYGDLQKRDIITFCKESVPDVKMALAMAERVSKWLSEQGVKVWR